MDDRIYCVLSGCNTDPASVAIEPICRLTRFHLRFLATALMS